MENKVATVTIVARNKAKNAFTPGGGVWYNMAEVAQPYFAKIADKETVEVTYHEEKGRKIVSKITKKVGTTTSNATQKTETTSTEKATTGFKCEVCGKELKDGKYKKCFMCNKANPEPKKEEKAEQPKEKKIYNSYDNPEKTAQIQRGNALNAASMVMSNPSVELKDTTPETMAEATIVIAERLLNWLRAE